MFIFGDKTCHKRATEKMFHLDYMSLDYMSFDDWHSLRPLVEVVCRLAQNYISEILFYAQYKDSGEGIRKDLLDINYCAGYVINVANIFNLAMKLYEVHKSHEAKKLEPEDVAIITNLYKGVCPVSKQDRVRANNTLSGFEKTAGEQNSMIRKMRNVLEKCPA